MRVDANWAICMDIVPFFDRRIKMQQCENTLSTIALYYKYDSTDTVKAYLLIIIQLVRVRFKRLQRPIIAVAAAQSRKKLLCHSDHWPRLYKQPVFGLKLWTNLGCRPQELTNQDIFIARS